MSKTLTILGCGYLGSELASRALDNGWTVSALTRNPDFVSKLKSIGLEVVVQSNLEDSNWHSELDADQDFVVNCVGSSSPNLDGYVKSYVEGQSSVMNWLKSGKVGTFVFTSSCSVYPQVKRKLVDETASCTGVSEKGGLLLAAEQISFPPPPAIKRSFILRLGGLYGPNRHLLLEKVKTSAVIEGNSDRILNLIHRDDAVGAIMACLLAKDSNIGRIYNLTDGHHYPRSQIVQWLAEKFDVPPPEFEENDSETTPNRKVSNNRIMEELDWSPKYPSFIEGYEEILS